MLIVSCSYEADVPRIRINVKKNIFSHCIELKRQKKKRPGKIRDPLFFLSLDLKLILRLQVIKPLQSEFKGKRQISSKPSNRFFRSSFETRLFLSFSGFCGKRNSRNVGKTEKKKNLKQKIERKLFFLLKVFLYWDWQQNYDFMLI